MITCPNCGAGNKPGSSACRMCATSLVGVVEAPAARVQPPASNLARNPELDSHHREEGKPPVEQEGIVCSECKTMNEPGWSFCQQCGKRLTKAAPAPPPQPPAASGIPNSLRTVPEQHAVVDPGVAQGLKTNPEPQPAEHGQGVHERQAVGTGQVHVDHRQVAARPAAVARHCGSEVKEQSYHSPPPPLEHSFKTVADDRPRVVARPPLPAAPPTVVDQPPAEPREREPDDSPMRTVPVETPGQLKPTAPIPTPPVQQKPVAATPPPPVAKLDTQPPSSAPPTRPPEPTKVAHGGAMSGVLCAQCG